jgi:integrase
MPRGAGVVRYAGKRGVVWRIKYADAAGRQVMETLGPEAEGWTRRKAEAELRERLVKVERKGWRKPAPLTFAEYAERWFGEGETKRGWTPGTVIEYRSVRRRLEAVLGPAPLAAVRPRHVAALVAELQAKGYAAATVARDLGVLSAVFESAVREELIESNPARRAERPKRPRRRWRILEPAEVARVERAFSELADAAEELERAWLAQSRVAFLVLVITGLRRHELLGLRWRDVDLIENVLRVVKSKSEAGERAVALPPKLAEELWQHRRRSSYQGDDELVFCHPERGSTLNDQRFADDFRAALKRAKIGDYLRPFHDLRHASLTLGAANGESAVALMTRAGHANMATTKVYLHLAGTVFRDEAERLEETLLRGRKLYSPESTSADPAESNPAPQAG